VPNRVDSQFSALCHPLSFESGVFRSRTLFDPFRAHSNDECIRRNVVNY